MFCFFSFLPVHSDKASKDNITLCNKHAVKEYDSQNDKIRAQEYCVWFKFSLSFHENEAQEIRTLKKISPL